MAGKYAYTALPAVFTRLVYPPGWNPNWDFPTVVTPLVYPPDWNPNWDFPAVTPRAYPPGYTPEFSIVATGANFTTTPSGINISSILYDHGTYVTNQPSADSEVIITAFIDGVPHKLRFSGDITFLDAIACPYSEVSGFWGTDSYIDVNFDMSSHGDKTLTFVVAGVVEGQIFTDTVSMTIRYSSSIALPLMAAKGTVWKPEITGGVWTCEFELIFTPGFVVVANSCAIRNAIYPSGTVVAGKSSSTGDFTINAEPSGFSVSMSGDIGLITELSGSVKRLRSYSTTFVGSAPGSVVNFRTYLDGVLQVSYSKNPTDYDYTHAWLTFDSRDGTVTIINP